jgi:hypothetical protein
MVCGGQMRAGEGSVGGGRKEHKRIDNIRRAMAVP